MDQPSLFDRDEPQPVVSALARIENAITDNTRAIDALADAVLRVLAGRDAHSSTPAPDDEHQEHQPEPDDEKSQQAANEEAEAAAPGAANAAARGPVQPPARWTELTGFESAAVVGPGWVQLGGKRWPFEVHTAAEITRIANAVKHDRSAPQVWVLSEVCEHLGLVAFPDDVDRSRRERITSLERNLAELPAAAEFLAPALDAGWTCNGRLEPWTLLRSAEGKIVHLILEPYHWMYDHDGRGVIADGGDDEREYPNAVTGPPEDRADEILRRVRWISDSLGVLPDSNPVRTMQRVIDADRRKRIKAAKDSSRPKSDAAGRKLLRVAEEPGSIPPFDGDAELSLDAVAPELIWPRIPSHDEIDAAEVAIELDQKYAYLATMSNTLYGIGEPQWISAEEIAWKIANNEAWFGAVRCEPRTAWHEPRIFPPHPALDGRRPRPTWLMGPTVDITRDDEEKGGGGWKLDDFGITGAYVTPDAGRLMEPFYNELRPALLAAEDIEDAELRAATQAHLKGGYKALTGKWEDVTILNSKYRQYRYQPLWRRQTIAGTAARLFRQVRRLELQHRGLWPVHVVTDGAWYVTSRAIGDQLIAAGDKAKFGQLRPKRVHELSSADKTALRQMSPEDKIISVPHALGIGTDTKGR